MAFYQALIIMLLVITYSGVHLVLYLP